MVYTLNNSVKIRNVSSPFTELFSILQRYEKLPCGLVSLPHQSDELKVLNQHVDNAIDVLLQGMQDLGQLIGVAGCEDKDLYRELKNIGFFISAITNLTEALNKLRLDNDFILRAREI